MRGSSGKFIFNDDFVASSPHTDVLSVGAFVSFSCPASSALVQAQHGVASLRVYSGPRCPKSAEDTSNLTFALDYLLGSCFWDARRGQYFSEDYSVPGSWGQESLDIQRTYFSDAACRGGQLHRSVSTYFLEGCHQIVTQFPQLWDSFQFQLGVSKGRINYPRTDDAVYSSYEYKAWGFTNSLLAPSAGILFTIVFISSQKKSTTALVRLLRNTYNRIWNHLRHAYAFFASHCFAMLCQTSALVSPSSSNAPAEGEGEGESQRESGTDVTTADEGRLAEMICEQYSEYKDRELELQRVSGTNHSLHDGPAQVRRLSLESTVGDAVDNNFVLNPLPATKL